VRMNGGDRESNTKAIWRCRNLARLEKVKPHGGVSAIYANSS